MYKLIIIVIIVWQPLSNSL